MKTNILASGGFALLLAVAACPPNVFAQFVADLPPERQTGPAAKDEKPGIAGRAGEPIDLNRDPRSTNWLDSVTPHSTSFRGFLSDVGQAFQGTVEGVADPEFGAKALNSFKSLVTTPYEMITMTQQERDEATFREINADRKAKAEALMAREQREEAAAAEAQRLADQARREQQRQLALEVQRREEERQAQQLAEQQQQYESASSESGSEVFEALMGLFGAAIEMGPSRGRSAPTYTPPARTYSPPARSYSPPASSSPSRSGGPCGSVGIDPRGTPGDSCYGVR